MPSNVDQVDFINAAREECGGDTGAHMACARQSRRRAKVRLCQSCVPKQGETESCGDVNEDGSCPSHCKLSAISRTDFSEAWKRVIRAFDGKMQVDEMSDSERAEHEQVRTEEQEEEYRRLQSAKHLDRVVEAMKNPDVNWVLRRTSSTEEDAPLDYVGWMQLLSYDSKTFAQMFPDDVVRAATASKCGKRKKNLCGCGVTTVSIAGSFSLGVSGSHNPARGSLSFCARKMFEYEGGVGVEKSWVRRPNDEGKSYGVMCSLHSQPATKSVFLNAMGEVDQTGLALKVNYDITRHELDVYTELGLPTSWFYSSGVEDPFDGFLQTFLMNTGINQGLRVLFNCLLYNCDNLSGLAAAQCHGKCVLMFGFQTILGPIQTLCESKRTHDGPTGTEDMAMGDIVLSNQAREDSNFKALLSSMWASFRDSVVSAVVSSTAAEALGMTKRYRLIIAFKRRGKPDGSKGEGLVELTVAGKIDTTVLDIPVFPGVDFKVSTSMKKAIVPVQFISRECSTGVDADTSTVPSSTGSVVNTETTENPTSQGRCYCTSQKFVPAKFGCGAGETCNPDGTCAKEELV